MDSYCIKPSYLPNKINITNDEVSNDNYWNSNRIRAAEIYQFPVYKFLSQYISKNNYRCVIDIGCGVSKKLEYLHKIHPKLEIIGIDQDEPIQYCKKNYNFGKWYSDDFEDTKLSTHIKSKLIICSDVIEHLANPDLLLDYIKNKLENNGHAIISTPERDLLWGPNCNHSPNKYHVREWNSSELKNYLRKNGFEVLNHLVTFPVKMSLTKFFYKEILLKALKFKTLKNNQMVIIKKKE
mgnify:CR=1 FL=1|tara:strand:- start:2745 stop:3458 length:714 start_codon:yes stop_codon:yes gene_type:complete